jgi:CRP-like cAMP-binding protein
MKEGFLEYLGRFDELTNEEKELVSGLLEIRTYDKRARLTNDGEVEQYLSIVVKGLTRKFFIKDKEEVIKHIAKEGDIVSSYVSYFSRTPSNCIIEAIEPTTVVSISRDNLEKLFESGERWERIGRKMMAEFLIEKEYWLLDAIRYTPRERFLRFLKEEPDLLRRVPQKYLASYLDIKPETFSRLKQLLMKKEGPVVPS